MSQLLIYTWTKLALKENGISFFWTILHPSQRSCTQDTIPRYVHLNSKTHGQLSTSSSCSFVTRILQQHALFPSTEELTLQCDPILTAILLPDCCLSPLAVGCNFGVTPCSAAQKPQTGPLTECALCFSPRPSLNWPLWFATNPTSSHP